MGAGSGGGKSQRTLWRGAVSERAVAAVVFRWLAVSTTCFIWGDAEIICNHVGLMLFVAFQSGKIKPSR